MIFTEPEQKTMTQPVERELIVMNVSRTDKGISLFVKSEEIEKFIRAHALHQEHLDSTLQKYSVVSPNAGWQGKIGYQLPTTVESLKQLSNWGGALHTGNQANLSFLVTKGLREGVTFEFEGLFSQSTVEKFMRDSKNQIKALYNEFIKQRNTILNITLREID